MSSDMNFMDIFFPSENGIFKNSVKDEFIDQSYNDDAIDQQSSYSFLKTEEWSPDPDPEDIFDSLLNFEDNQFDLIDNDLKVLPSSSSDSGLSSALSLANEEQLSPPLATEDDQIEISNSPAGTPQNIMDFDLDSPSVDSPMISYSLINSNIGSPATDVAEEMDEDQTVVAVVHPNNTFADVNTIVEEPDIKLERVAKPPKIHIVPQEENTINLRNITGNGKRNIRKLIRVTPMGSNNPRSILLPVNLTDMKEVKTIKIINASQAKNFKGFKINQSSLINKQIQRIKEEDSSSERGNSSDEVFECDSQYPRLKLTAEEKRLLQKEGIKLPSHYPLTKQEERELKRIRRKIRNKISAQDSRKRKKEYVDGLEDRVKQCTDENISLLKRIKALQIQNQSLAGQLKRLQALLQKGNKSAPPSTCLIVLLLSLALIAVPNLLSDSNSNNEMAQEQEQSEKMPPLAGRSRALLYTKQLMDEELQQYNEELLQEVEGLLDHDYSPAIQLPLSKRPRMEPEPKYVDHVGGTLGGCQETTIRKYIEPPLDDVWPPPKPGGQKIVKVFDKLEALTNELKINISDSEGTRTVLVKMPQEQ